MANMVSQLRTAGRQAVPPLQHAVSPSVPLPVTPPCKKPTKIKICRIRTQTRRGRCLLIVPAPAVLHFTLSTTLPMLGIKTEGRHVDSIIILCLFVTQPGRFQPSLLPFCILSVP